MKGRDCVRVTIVDQLDQVIESWILFKPNFATSLGWSIFTDVFGNQLQLRCSPTGWSEVLWYFQVDDWTVAASLNTTAQ